MPRGPCPVGESPMRIRTALLGVLLLAQLAAQATAALPPFFPKPAAWTSYMVPPDHLLVKDGDFATWVKNAQTAAAPRTFKFLASSGTCYGGRLRPEPP